MNKPNYFRMLVSLILTTITLLVFAPFYIVHELILYVATKKRLK